MSGGIVKSVQGNPLNLGRYLPEETYARADLIVDLNNRLSDIDKAHCSAPAKLLCHCT